MIIVTLWNQSLSYLPSLTNVTAVNIYWIGVSDLLNLQCLWTAHLAPSLSTMHVKLSPSFPLYLGPSPTGKHAFRTCWLILCGLIPGTDHSDPPCIFLFFCTSWAFKGRRIEAKDGSSSLEWVALCLGSSSPFLVLLFLCWILSLWDVLSFSRLNIWQCNLS